MIFGEVLKYFNTFFTVVENELGGNQWDVKFVWQYLLFYRYLLCTPVSFWISRLSQLFYVRAYADE